MHLLSSNTCCKCFGLNNYEGISAWLESFRGSVSFSVCLSGSNSYSGHKKSQAATKAQK